MRTYCGALIALLLVTVTVDANAQGVPGATTFTARVSVDGVPANGNFDFTLALFDAAAGGDKVWEENHTGVTVEDGLAFLSMGSLTTLDATVFDGSALFLDVTFGTQRMDTRLPIQSVPYAMRAGVASSAELLGDLGPDDVLPKGSSLSCSVGDVVTAIDGDSGDVVCSPGGVGLQGPQGPKGDTGDTGDTGAQGPQGLQGDTGAQGGQGIQGIKGDKGDQGDTGSQGIPGIKGDKGDQGDTGSQGIPGIKGDKGDKGDKGNTGAQGTAGISNYTIVKKECSSDFPDCTVSCTDGRVLGGGCEGLSTNMNFAVNRPKADGSGWYCYYGDAEGAIAWAICADVN